MEVIVRIVEKHPAIEVAMGNSHFELPERGISFFMYPLAQNGSPMDHATLGVCLASAIRAPVRLPRG